VLPSSPVAQLGRAVARFFQLHCGPYPIHRRLGHLRYRLVLVGPLGAGKGFKAKSSECILVFDSTVTPY